MIILVELFGIVLVGFGVAYLIRPTVMKKYIVFWKKGRRLQMGAGLSLLIGIIFLLAAAQCKVGWLITLFGIMALIKGVVLFVIKQEKAIAMINWWAERPVIFLRTHALLAIILGALLIYSA